MSHYARNHLQDDWAAHAADDTARRMRQAEREAGWYFEQATKRQKAEFEASMRALPGMSGRRREHAREAARTRWRTATGEARALFDATVECLLAHGEVSTELDDAWTALSLREGRPAVAAE